jgi:hypothetical protein
MGAVTAKHATKERAMRVLSPTIAALLISVSHAALAQEQTMPQGGAAQAEHQCADLPQLQSVGMTPEGVVAQPGRQSAERSETRPAEMTADELVAQLPERPVAEQSEPRPAEMTAEEFVAQLPEAPTAQPAEMTAQEFVAQLPEAPTAEPAEMTAQEFVAQLPEAPTAAPAEMTAQEFVAQLPEAPTAEMTAEELVAQLPERPVAKKPADTTAEEFVARLPEAPPADMQEDEKRQPEAMKAEMQDQEAQTEMPEDPQWATVSEAKLGTAVDIPRAVLSTPDGHAHKQVGRRYKTRDGRAKVAIWTQRNTKHDTPASYLHKTFNIPRATVDYERFTSDFAVISGLFGTRVYYIRCNYSPRSGSFHCFDLAYPVREKRIWDPVVTRMSRSLRAHDG